MMTSNVKKDSSLNSWLRIGLATLGFVLSIAAVSEISNLLFPAHSEWSARGRTMYLITITALGEVLAILILWLFLRR